jgi:hypothetical protein
MYQKNLKRVIFNLEGMTRVSSLATTCAVHNVLARPCKRRMMRSAWSGLQKIIALFVYIWIYKIFILIKAIVEIIWIGLLISQINSINFKAHINAT